MLFILGPAFYGRPHDQMSYISPERAQNAVANLPVPVGMFLNMAHIPPRFYNQHQQALQGVYGMFSVSTINSNVFHKFVL